MISLIIQISLLLLIPVPILRWENRYRVVRVISPIILCYLIGIGAGNIPWIVINKELMTYSYGVSVLMAIPLLLFSSNFQSLLRQVKPALLAFLLGVASVILSSLAAFLLFHESVPTPDAVTGMMIGVYTGGTPNMSAIGVALGVEEEVFLILNSADIVCSGIYFLLLLTAGKYLLGLILPTTRQTWNPVRPENLGESTTGRRKKMAYISTGVMLSLVVVFLSAGLSMLLVQDRNLERVVPLIILGVTTLSIGASFHGRIRSLPYTYSTANYFLLVFALAMGSLSDFSELLASSSRLFLFCGMVVFGSVLIHMLLAFIFRIDRDTAIIASTAALFGPQFIGPVAESIGNREVIGVGIALGLIGIAMGNYLGLGVAFLIQ